MSGEYRYCKPDWATPEVVRDTGYHVISAIKLELDRRANNDTVEQFLREIKGQLAEIKAEQAKYEQVNKVLTEINNLPGTIGNKVREAADQTVQRINDFTQTKIGQVLNAINTVLIALAALNAAISLVAALLSKFGQDGTSALLKQIQQQLNQILSKLSGMDMNKLINAINQLDVKMNQIADQIVSEVRKVINEVNKILPTVRAWLIDHLNEVTKWMQDALNKVVQEMTRLMTLQYSHILNALQSILSDLFSKIRGEFDQIKGMFKGFDLSSLSSLLNGFLSQLRGDNRIDRVLKAVERLTSQVDTLYKAFNDLSGRLGKALAEIENKFLMVDMRLSEIKLLLMDLVSRIKGLESKLATSIGFLQEMISRMVGDVKDTKQAAQSSSAGAIAQQMQQMGSQLTGKLDSVGSQIQSGQKETNRFLDELAAGITNTTQEVRGGNVENNKFLQELGQKVEQTNQSVNQTNQSIATVNTQLSSLDSQIKATNSSIDKVEGDIATLNQNVNSVTKQNQELVNQLNGITAKVDTNLATFNTNLSNLDTKVNTGLSGLTGQLNGTNSKVDGVTGLLNLTNSRLNQQNNQVNSKLLSLSNGIQNCNTSINRVDAKVNTGLGNIYQRVNATDLKVTTVGTKLETRVNSLTTSTALGLTAVNQNIGKLDNNLKVSTLQLTDTNRKLDTKLTTGLQTINGKVNDVNGKLNLTNLKLDDVTSDINQVGTKLGDCCDAMGEKLTITGQIKTKRCDSLVGEKDLKTLTEQTFVYNSLGDAVQALSKQTEEVRKDFCKLLDRVVLPIPESWNLKREDNRSQLVITYAEDKGNGKIGASRWIVSIPHCSLTRATIKGKKFPAYTKGDFMGILDLTDGSKLVVNAKSRAEALRMLRNLAIHVKKSKLPKGFSLAKIDDFAKVTPRKGNIKNRRVIPVKATYYPVGRGFDSKSQQYAKPSWEIYYR